MGFIKHSFILSSNILSYSVSPWIYLRISYTILFRRVNFKMFVFGLHSSRFFFWTTFIITDLILTISFSLSLPNLSFGTVMNQSSLVISLMRISRLKSSFSWILRIFTRISNSGLLDSFYSLLKFPSSLLIFW